jgi:two-component system nitrogen regulation sensor histidine kinase GlnL
MTTTLAGNLRTFEGRTLLGAAPILAALPTPVLVLDRGNIVRSVNPAAEQFFDAGSSVLIGQSLEELIPPHSPIFGLVETVRRTDAGVTEYVLSFDSLRTGHRTVALQVAPVTELPGHVVLQLNELSIAVKIDRQLTHRHAARSVSAMAAMLAHEVKNPL